MAVVGLCVLAVLGALMPVIPVLGSAASLAISLYSPWIAVLALAGTATSGLAWWFGGERAALAAALAGGAAALAACAIVGAMTRTALLNGVEVSWRAAFDPSPRFVALPPDRKVTFEDTNGDRIELAIYFPASRQPGEMSNILVYVHGGGWISGSSEMRGPDMRWFASRGWLVVSVGYRLSTPERSMWDRSVGQVGCALAWVARNGETFGADPTRIVLLGDSAGGTLALDVAYSGATDQLAQSCDGDLPPISAVVALYPPLDLRRFHDEASPATGARKMANAFLGGSPQEVPERYRALSPYSHISAAAPPTLIISGENDSLVDVEDVEAFVEEASGQGIKARSVILPFAAHGFDKTDSIGSQLFRVVTAAFGEEQLGNL